MLLSMYLRFNETEFAVKCGDALVFYKMIHELNKLDSELRVIVTSGFGDVDVTLSSLY